MGKKFSIYIPIIIAIVFVTGIFLGTSINRNSSSSGTLLSPKNDKINNVLKYVEQEYVDTVNTDKLSEAAIVDLLKGLDPHSVYIPADQMQAANESLEGNFSGIGIQFNMLNDTIIVINTVAGGPSAKVGILPGDRLIKVNKVNVAGVKMNSDDIVKRLKGPEGTKVMVTIKRMGSKNNLNFEITRNKIPLYSVDASFMLNKKTGYLKISQFARTTPEEFVSAIDKLHSQGMNGLVLDLRGNGGGYLDIATHLANQFLKKGSLIVYTLGRAKPREDFKASGNGICLNDKLVILIDEYSASASEILAGAIQDNDRGLIIGRRSFGKGLVQEQAVLADGSAIRLTIARYYTPSGRSIQKPYNHGEESYFKDLTERYLHGEFENKDSIHFNDSLKYRTSKGRIVFGGGGIMPDIFVPLDTLGFSKFYYEVRDKNLIYKFSFNFTDNNRIVLKNIKSSDEMAKYMERENIYSKFIDYCEKQGVKLNRKDENTSEELIKTQIESFVVRNFLDNTGFYEIIRKIDNTLQKATEAIADEKMLLK